MNAQPQTLALNHCKKKGKIKWMSGWISVFDKLTWCTIGLKSFLFGTAQFSLWARGAVNYDYIVTQDQDVFPMAYTLTIVEPIWPMLKNSWLDERKLSTLTSFFVSVSYTTS